MQIFFILYIKYCYRLQIHCDIIII